MGEGTPRGKCLCSVKGLDGLWRRVCQVMMVPGVEVGLGSVTLSKVLLVDSGLSDNRESES